MMLESIAVHLVMKKFLLYIQEKIHRIINNKWIDCENI